MGVEDLGEDLEAINTNERQEYYEKCQICDQEGIRYVHIMEHPDYIGQLRVGYRCAEKMEEDYIKPKKRERKLRNKHSRRVNFLKKEWNRKSTGNYTLKYKDRIVTIVPSKYKSGEYGVVINGRWVWDINGVRINSLHKAKLVAFNLLDEF